MKQEKTELQQLGKRQRAALEGIRLYGSWGLYSGHLWDGVSDPTITAKRLEARGLVSCENVAPPQSRNACIRYRLTDKAIALFDAERRAKASQTSQPNKASSPEMSAPRPTPMYRNESWLLSGLKNTNATRRAVEAQLAAFAVCPVYAAWEGSLLVTSRRLTDRERHNLEGFTAGLAWAAKMGGGAPN